MLYKIHYFCLEAGGNALYVLLGVYMAAYTGATPSEIGLLFMLMPFVSMIFKPLICSYADRTQSHRKCIITCDLVTVFSFVPFILVPYSGADLYESHPRLCWYLLVAFKIIGCVAYSSGDAIGDSLAINFAARTGTDFGSYRVWGTISWMISGLVVGQLNEIWFLPKYVFGFMVLILSALTDAFVCYLWPEEYFRIVSASELKQLELSNNGKRGSLVPEGAVWKNAKQQLKRLVTFSCRAKPSNGDQNGLGKLAESSSQSNESIDKRTQLRILWLLLRRDPRIVCYLFLFAGGGLAGVGISFFFMSLADICHTRDACNFSQLAGYLQVSMSLIETLLFLRIRKVIDKIGKVNTIALGFGMATCKFTFYGTIWSDVSPYWSLLSESVSGSIFCVFITLMVETGHMFSTEVEQLMPELLERGIVEEGDEKSRERLKASLAATMQGLNTSIYDGVGRGLGALFYGHMAEAYSYRTLWLSIGLFMLVMLVLAMLATLFERCFDLKMGLAKTKADSELGLGEAEANAKRKLGILASIQDRPAQ